MYEHTQPSKIHCVSRLEGNVNSKQYDEMNEKFEEIEHQQFGEDGLRTR